MASGVWSFIVVSFSGNDCILEVDNVVIGSITMSSQLYNVNSLGYARYGGTTAATSMNGEIDQVRIFESNLSSQTKTNLYNGGLGC